MPLNPSKLRQAHLGPSAGASLGEIWLWLALSPCSCFCCLPPPTPPPRDSSFLKGGPLGMALGLYLCADEDQDA